MSPRRTRASRELVTIFWRDIPAQVTGRDGDDKVAIELPSRFMVAIDRAAVVADLVKYDEYIGEWRREAVPFSGDINRAAEEAVAGIDEEFDSRRMAALIANGGFEAAAADADEERREAT